MSKVVIYKSKSGYAKGYAEMISKALEADIFELSKISLKDLEKYETVIYGGGLYIGGINKVKFITKNDDFFKNKNVIVFFCGATPPRKEDIDFVVNRNFTKDQLKRIKVFYMRGGFDFDRLTKLDKFLMRLLKFKLKRQKVLTADEKGMLNSYDTPLDFTNDKNTIDLVNYIKSL